MGRYGKRARISKFQAPSRKMVENLDWQRVVAILSGSEENSGEQITALVDIWYKYIVSKAQHRNEPLVKDYIKKLNSYEAHIKGLLDLVREPGDSINDHIITTISNELKLEGIDASIEKILFCADLAIENLGIPPEINGVEYIEPFETLIIDHKEICEAYGYIYNGFAGDGSPTKLAKYIFKMHSQLPKEVQVKQLLSTSAVATRIKRLIKKEKSRKSANTF